MALFLKNKHTIISEPDNLVIKKRKRLLKVSEFK